MKKLIVFCFMLLLVCGCSANYEISINGDKIHETLTLIETDKSIFDKVNDTGWTIRESFDALIKGDEFSEQEYNIKSLNTDDELGVKYSTNSLDLIENSSILNQCYSNPSFIVEETVVKIDTGTSFECYELYDNLDSVTVSFKTDNKVLYTNADSVLNDTYVWNITKDGNKQIQISYDSSIRKPNYILYTVGAIIGAILLIIMLFVMIKVKRKNNF